jgi:hypothetical protein
MFLLQVFTDALFFAGINSAVRFHSKRKATVYYYCFDYRGSSSFSSLVTNSTVDIGECLPFPEHVHQLQLAVRKGYVFVSFPNTQLSICTPAHAHTQNRLNVTMLMLMCT